LPTVPWLASPSPVPSSAPSPASFPVPIPKVSMLGNSLGDGEGWKLEGKEGRMLDRPPSESHRRPWRVRRIW
jgi:hypothetical protein